MVPEVGSCSVWGTWCAGVRQCESSDDFRLLTVAVLSGHARVVCFLSFVDTYVQKKVSNISSFWFLDLCWSVPVRRVKLDVSVIFLSFHGFRVVSAPVVCSTNCWSFDVADGWREVISSSSGSYWLDRVLWSIFRVPVFQFHGVSWSSDVVERLHCLVEKELYRFRCLKVKEL